MAIFHTHTNYSRYVLVFSAKYGLKILVNILEFKFIVFPHETHAICPGPNICIVVHTKYHLWVLQLLFYGFKNEYTKRSVASVCLEPC